MKKILIIMAERTGNGHKSAANAIEQKFKTLGFEVKQVDGFSFMGKRGQKLEDCYIPMTLKHPFIGKICYGFSQVFTNFSHWLIYHFAKKEMLKEIESYKPELIISVHGLFSESVSKLLSKNNLHIPFMINAIDLVNPPRVWRNKKADITFLATEKAKKQYLKLGFKEEQLVVSGFPIREDIKRPDKAKQIGKNVNILLVNPSVNLNKNIRFAKEVSRIENASIKFVCGRDEKLYNRLIQEQNKSNLSSKIEIFDFVPNMNELLSESHILLAKAGPNMILEGTKSGNAIIITGHIPGQEAKNYKYVTENGYGDKCENPKKIYNLLTGLLESGKINEYLKNATTSTCNDGAEIIATTVQDFFKNKN